MAKIFKFSLNPLKKLRENRLLIARRELFVVETKMADLKEKLKQSIKAREELILDSHKINEDISLALTAASIINTQNTVIKKIEEEIIGYGSIVERHRNWVTHLGRELKIVEKLEEKKREEYYKHLNAIEKRKADRWVAERWGHKMAQHEEEIQI